MILAIFDLNGSRFSHDQRPARDLSGLHAHLMPLFVSGRLLAFGGLCRDQMKGLSRAQFRALRAEAVVPGATVAFRGKADSRSWSAPAHL